MKQTGAIAAIAHHARRDTQQLLGEMAARWRSENAKVAGVLTENNDSEEICSAAFLRDIASGRRFSIELDAAPPGTVCHLDAAGIDDACAALLPQIPGADIVILSKFGKTEAAHQGLWEAFASVITANKPLLTTVSQKHIDAWKAFAPHATWLEPDLSSIKHWWQTVKV